VTVDSSQSVGSNAGEGKLPGPRSRSALPIVAMLVAALIVVVVASLTADRFLTADNIRAVLNQASITGIVAVCATSLTLSGNLFSIALGQTATLAAIVFAVVMRADAGFIPALAAALGAATVVGILQGGVTALGANPIVTTLGASSLLSGLAGMTAGPNNVQLPQTSTVTWLASGRPLGVSTQTWAFIVLVLVTTIVMRMSRLGRLTFLTGTNRAAARASGIAVWKVTIAAFVIASLGAAITGVFGAAQFNLATLDAYPSLDFDVVAAILVGGTAVTGGIGSPLWSGLGAVFIALVDNYLLLQGWSQGVRTGVLGLIVIVAVITFHLSRRSTRGTA
jgi:simple sugar transport system permease protein/ribose transport system permease protein